MSINTLHANGGVLLFSGERILLYCDKVELRFEPSSVPQFKGNKNGTRFLTTHRVIFRNRNHNHMLQSFSLPFLQLRAVELKQLMFGANYIKGKLITESGNAKAKEAASCGYYNPANPHNIYIPATQPSAPPSYEDATQKISVTSMEVAECTRI